MICVSEEYSISYLVQFPFQNLQSKIIKEYKIMKSDPKYVEKKMRCDYLHNKLSYIKKRILEYDQLHLDQS